MTLAIAVPFPGGSILCADARVDATDASSPDEGNALLSVTAGRRMFAITWVAGDARAGRMLASEIASVACNAGTRQDFLPGIKRVMGDWFRSYGVAPAPAMQFLIASNLPEDEGGRILLCEPPSTITDTSGAAVIGNGARPIYPWLGLLGARHQQPLTLRSAVLRIAWLTHLARRYEGQRGSGETEMMVLSNRGSFIYLDRNELRQAQTLGEKLDMLLLDTARQVLCAESDQSPQAIAEEFLRGYFEVMEQNPQILFPSLGFLERQAAATAREGEIPHPGLAPAVRPEVSFSQVSGLSAVG